MNNQTQNVSVDILKVHPRNAEFFDDISGKDYEDFKNSIKEDGIISDIIVAPDMTIISGHQRYKAAKELGIKMVPIQIREDLIDEDKKLKVLLAANFGRKHNSEAKQRKIATEYVKLCGYENGEMGNGRKKEVHNGLPTKLTLDEIAKQLGTSKTNLKRALSIERNLTDSMKELLDTGVISKTLAADVIAGLSSEEQEQLITNLDVTKKITAREVKKYIEEIRSLKENPEIKEVDSPETLAKMRQLEEQYFSLQAKTADKEAQLQKLKAEYKYGTPEYMIKIQKLEQELKTDKEELEKLKEENTQLSSTLMEQEKMINHAIGASTNYQLVSNCSEITLEMLDFIKKMSKYDYMAESFNQIPIATRIEYKKCIQSVKKWADRILETIDTEENICDVVDITEKE